MITFLHTLRRRFDNSRHQSLPHFRSQLSPRFRHLSLGWLCCGVAAALGSCSENTPITYALNDRVYFYETEQVLAVTTTVTSMNYSFALKPSSLQQDTVKVNVRVMGRTADHDRHFRAVAVGDSTTAQAPQHYELLEGIIPAGQQDGYLPILLKRTADTQQRSVTLLLQLTDGGDFTTGHPDMLHFRLSWADMLLRPAHWPYYFGQYSTTKYRFAIDVLGVTDWQQATRFNNGSEPGLYTAAQLQLFASQLNDAYKEYRKTHAPIYVDPEASDKQEIYYAPNS